MMLGTRKHGHASLKLAHPTALPDAMRDGVVELRSLRTDPAYRGLGEASMLLAKTTVEADIAKRFMMLWVKPDDDGPMDTEALAKFYTDHGFITIQADPVLMVRPYVGAGIYGGH